MEAAPAVRALRSVVPSAASNVPAQEPAPPGHRRWSSAGTPQRVRGEAAPMGVGERKRCRSATPVIEVAAGFIPPAVFRVGAVAEGPLTLTLRDSSRQIRCWGEGRAAFAGRACGACRGQRPADTRPAATSGSGFRIAGWVGRRRPTDNTFAGPYIASARFPPSYRCRTRVFPRIGVLQPYLRLFYASQEMQPAKWWMLHAMLV